MQEASAPEGVQASRIARGVGVHHQSTRLSDTPAGAHASTMIYRIVETAKANKIEPFHYLQYIITKLPTAKTAEEITALKPQNTLK